MANFVLGDQLLIPAAVVMVHVFISFFSKLSKIIDHDRLSFSTARLACSVNKRRSHGSPSPLGLRWGNGRQISGVLFLVIIDSIEYPISRDSRQFPERHRRGGAKV